MMIFAIASLPIMLSSAITSTHMDVSSLAILLKSFNLCLASTIISVTCLLNFSLAAVFVMILGIPLIYFLPAKGQEIVPKVTQAILLVFLGIGWLAWAEDEVRRAIWHWEILGVWFAPFVCMVYMPLLLQAATAVLLPV
jgi:GPI-anchor transamidase subunit GAA1